MLVLDGLRELPEDKKLNIPPFHLGHLGFVPGLEVYYREDVQHDPRHGVELTLTPFKGGRGNLFLLKCVFSERPGVILNALKAFKALNLNIVSLESATIQASKKHVLFGIISWDDSPHERPVEIDQGTRQKLIEILPLIPLADWRYLVLIELLVLFCGNSLDLQIAADGNVAPNIQLKAFDAFREASADWKETTVMRSGAAKKSKIYLDAASLGLESSTTGKVILLSETETKTLRVILPSVRRKDSFLHIAFVHSNKRLRVRVR